METLTRPHVVTSRVDVRTTPATARIAGIASAKPSRRYSQDELLAIFGYAGDGFAEGIFARSAIESRPMVPAPEEFARNADPLHQYERAQAACLELGAAAAEQALSAAGGTRADVGCLVLATTSQLHMPTLTSLLITRLGLPLDIAQYNLLGHGCAGAIPTLALAEGFLRRHPEQLVVGVCVDIGSLTLLPSSPAQKNVVVANSLFSDAAVALAVQGPARGAGGIALIDHASLQSDPAGYDAAVFTMTETGSRGSLLGKELPARSAKLIVEAVDAMLARNGLDRGRIRHWAIHPGGRAILEGIQAGFGLSDEQLAPSRQILRTVGNAGAPTCLLSLEAIAAGGTSPGDWGVVLGVGPGLVAVCALVRWT